MRTVKKHANRKLTAVEVPDQCVQKRENKSYDDIWAMKANPKNLQTFWHKKNYHKPSVCQVLVMNCKQELQLMKFLEAVAVCPCKPEPLGSQYQYF